MSAVAINRITRPRMVATTRGVPTAVISADAQHGVDQPIGTASITLPLPLPVHLRGDDEHMLNQPLELQFGYDHTGLRTRFAGRIDADRMEINERDRSATIHARGWAALLDWPEENDFIFAGPIALHDIVRALCAWRGVPAYRVDPITTHEGGPALLGGNAHVDEGNVIIPRRTSPLTWIDRKCRLYGYRIYDTPAGELRVRRVSGQPAAVSSPRYGEGVNAYRISRTRDLSPMVTYWTIEGATYTDSDGIRIPVRSFPASVPDSRLLRPPGYRANRLTDSDIVTSPRADTIRYVQEIDSFQPYRELRWECAGDPDRDPGEAVAVTAPSFGVDDTSWLMSVRERFDEGGYVADMAAWAGGSTTLPAGDDLATVTLSGIWHVGDEHLPHYVNPSPAGTTVRVPFTVPAEYTSIAVSGRGHGMNSYLLDGANADSTVSTIVVMQGGEEVGSAELPVMPENLLDALDYTDDRHWTAFRMPVPGQLAPGPAELRFVAGNDARASGGPIDDFEVKNPTIELRGAGKPALPWHGGGA